MKFRYFLVRGETLKAYLVSEKTEMEQYEAQSKALLKDRDDIESYRPSRTGGIDSLIFKAGKQPEGMVRASKNLPKEEVMPHGKKKEMAPFREFLKSVKVTEDCQALAIKLLGLPTFVIGAHAMSRSGMAMYHSRIGHVGTQVVVEVPVADPNSENPVDKKPYPGHADLQEIEAWKYVKLHADFKDFKPTGQYYVLKQRE